ncbi:MAG: NADH-quinone oxidoreductase subunit N [Thermodesulfovibrio sp.]|nr:NADH-quinone oxidoreductase subunit N [Thermodesulfovibrio sp.]
MTQYLLLLPEITLFVLGVITFCYGFIRRESKHLWIFGLLTFAVSLAVAVVCFNHREFSAEAVKISEYKQLMRVFIFTIGLLVLVLSYEDLKKNVNKAAEYFFLLIISLFGMNIMIVANDLLILYLSLETFSLALYTLAGFYQKERVSVEAGLKYFILGTLSSVLLLACIAFLYGITGSTSYEILRSMKVEDFSFSLGVLFLVASFAFKLSLVPFHAWAPDVYQGAPTSVTAFFSTAPKVAVFSALINIFLSFSLQTKPEGLIIILSSLSMFLGNLLALRQTNLKRMLAYSSIAHSGYMFMAFLLSDNLIVLSLIPYLIVYVFMNIGIFAVIISIKEETLNKYYGLGKYNPIVALCLIIILFSFTGIPPTAGFVVKLNLFKNVFSAGYSELVFFALLMSILSAFYYLRVVFYLYKDAPINFKYNKNNITLALALLCCIFLLLVGVLPDLILFFFFKLW